MVNFGSPNGCAQAGMRPAVVIQNDVGNQYSPTVIVAPMTSRMSKANIPTHVLISEGDGGIKMDSLVLAEQITLINKFQIERTLGKLSSQSLNRIDRAIKVSLAL